ncbi:efflux RND transporter periplasmic adaptor subunit [Paraburkholderia silvatlantica]|uniref:efflux RND transporter periplasmic adaptor subunit n=1 Tax=Paraburkholderia silvatlantica TaxID=321895 RepID=UPI003751B56D
MTDYWKMTSAVAAILLAMTACKRGNDPGEPAGQAGTRAQVSVAILHPQAMPLTTELPGRVVASLEAEVRPQVSGIIQKRLFVEGSEVRAGQPLYRIDPATYQAAYDNALAVLARAQAAIPGIQAKARRNKALVGLNAVSRQDYEDALDALSQARANVAAAKADVETARINLDYTTIRAPITGRIERSSLTPGALVTANQASALTIIRQIDPVNVDLTQSSASLIDLRQAIGSGRIQAAGSDVKVILKLENGTTYPLTGRLAFAESSVNTTTGAYTLRAILRNPEGLLLPGMYVRALVEEGVAPRAFLVPQRAVSRDVRGDATALLVRGGRVVQVTLAGARQAGNDWVVEKGLKDGDQLIVEGSQKIGIGDAVEAVRVAVDRETGQVHELQKDAVAHESGNRG